MYLRFLFYAFLIYLLYRLVFGFIIPVYKTTRQMKRQFREMNSRMEDYMNQQQSAYSTNSSEKQTSGAETSSNKEQVGDYIDFEEVK